MRRALALAAAAALAAPATNAAAALWRPFAEPSDGRVRPVQALFDEGRPEAVVSALTPEFLQRLRGTDLRQAYVLLGDSLDQLGRPDKALGIYQLGVGLFPRNVDLLTRQAGILHRQGLDEQARPLFLKALRHEPRHWGAHLGLAEIARDLGRLDQAADHYEVALETVGERPAAWRDYARVLLAQRDHKTAELALLRARQAAPADPETALLLAFARRGQDDLDGALARLEEALALGAEAPARRAKALWLLEAGRAEDAAAQARALLAEAPSDPAALWTLARAELSRGRPAEAARRAAELEAACPAGSFCRAAGKRLAAALAAP